MKPMITRSTLRKKDGEKMEVDQEGSESNGNNDMDCDAAWRYNWRAAGGVRPAR